MDSISSSGIGVPGNPLPINRITPFVRNTLMREAWSSAIRTNVYPGNRGRETIWRRSLHWRVTQCSGRKASTPFSWSSTETFFSNRGRVRMANQHASSAIASNWAESNSSLTAWSVIKARLRRSESHGKPKLFLVPMFQLHLPQQAPRAPNSIPCVEFLFHPFRPETSRRTPPVSTDRETTC